MKKIQIIETNTVQNSNIYNTLKYLQGSMELGYDFQGSIVDYSDDDYCDLDVYNSLRDDLDSLFSEISELNDMGELLEDFDYDMLEDIKTVYEVLVEMDDNNISSIVCCDV